MSEANNVIDPVALVQQLVQQQLASRPRGLPTYRAPSPAAFNTAVARAEESAQAVAPALQNRVAVSEQGLQTLQSEEAAMAAAIREAEMAKQAREQIRADQVRTVANNLGAGIADDPSSRIVALSLQAQQLRDNARLLRGTIDERAAVSVIDDPLTWIMNQIELPGLVQQQNSMVGKASAMEQEANQLTNLTIAQKNLANQSVPNLSAAEAEASARIAEGNARIRTAQAANQHAQVSTEAANQLFATNVSGASLQGQKLAQERDEAWKKYQTAADQVRFAVSEEERRLRSAALLTQVEQRTGPEQAMEVLRRQIANFYAVPVESIPLETVRRMSSELRTNMNAISQGSLGTNPHAAVQNYEQSNFQFGQNEFGRPKQQLVDTVSRMLSQTVAMRAVVQGTKPTASVISKANDEVIQLVNRQFAFPESQGPENNLAALPSPTLMFQRDARTGTVRPSAAIIEAANRANISPQTLQTIGQLLSTQIAAPVGTNVPSTLIVDTITRGLQANNAPPGYAQQLAADYFRLATTARNLSRDVRMMGINIPQEFVDSYRIQVDRPGFFAGKATIDLTRPEGITEYIEMQKLNRDIASGSRAMIPGGGGAQ